MFALDQWFRLLEELRREGVSQPRVLGAMEKVPRHHFVPPEGRGHAYQNIPLPIGNGQTISQPLVVAMMTEALKLTGNERVLEIGTGSGYQCAILAELSRSVISMERLEPLANTARQRLAWLGYSNIQVIVGDGSLGCRQGAPYDAILVTAASPVVPEPLVDQLSENGRLVLPIGRSDRQELLLLTRRDGKIVPTQLGPVRFVPLIGEAAWPDRGVGIYSAEDE